MSIPLTLQAQITHPTAAMPDCCSTQTGLPYTFDPNEAKQFFQLYIVNKPSEKAAFYFGKYDAWKESSLRDTELFNQSFVDPPGTLPIAPGIYLDQTEVANIHFREFLYFVAKDSGKYSDKKYLPVQDNKMNSKYFFNSEFYFYPVTAVSFENAESYCNWRAEKLNLGLSEMIEGETQQYKFRGRLPSEEEWLIAAGSSDQGITETIHTINKKGIQYLKEDILPNRFIAEHEIKSKYNGYNVNLKAEQNSIPLETPAYIYGFQPNEKGFFNLYGNVKELVSEGYAIGGSFKTSNSESEIWNHEDTQSYKTDVGFRCVVEIINN